MILTIRNPPHEYAVPVSIVAIIDICKAIDPTIDLDPCEAESLYFVIQTTMLGSVLSQTGDFNLSPF